MSLRVVILAAGLGKRMYSKLPKVLHLLGGKPLLEHVVQTAQKLNPSEPPIIIYGHAGEKVKHALAHLEVLWIPQKEQLGTAHALLQALPELKPNDRVLVLYGDVPFISVETLKNFLTHTPLNALGIITAKVSHPKGFGRIIRNSQNGVINIIEEKDLTANEKNIDEINSGIYLFPENFLTTSLSEIETNNVQKEYYLTDTIKIAVSSSIPIQTFSPLFPEEILGINDKEQLASLERIYQRFHAKKLMQQGVTILDPNRFDLRGELTAGLDVVIDINVIIEGHVILGNNCIIGPNTLLRNVILGNDVLVKANCVLEGAEISDHAVIGPFARIRPGTIIGPNAHIGNFVEIKNSFINESSKVNHLSYIGDSDIGKRVNVGAGTITCNYDGINKHRTIVEDEAFIGSNTELVAPLKIGKGATIGAGSTITADAPPNQLTLARVKQRSIPHWKRKQKKEA